MKNEAILCVDDEAIILMAMKRELKSHFCDRFRFETALDAEDGLETIRELVKEGVSVILVISDWLMPGMKGDRFLAVVKAEFPGIRTIMVTGHADQDSIERVIKDGHVSAVLKKPWNRQDLLATVDRCVDAESLAGR